MATNITSLYGLHHMGDNLAEDYTLLNDIDASPTDPSLTDDWSAGDYVEGDWVKYSNGNTYYCILDTTSGQLPTDGTYWELMWVSSEGWIPITPFTGSLDGSGYKISNLFISRGAAEQALFGELSTAGVVHDLMLRDFDVSALTTWAYAGGMAGDCYGTIQRCSLSGSVDSVGGNYAGLVGRVRPSGVVEDCYNLASINGSVNIGGIAGSHLSGGVVQRCYNYGLLNNTAGDSFGVSSLATDSYYDSDTSGDATSGGTAKTTSGMQDITTYSGWDIVDESAYTNEVWFIDDGNDYPRLGYEYVAPPSTGIVVLRRRLEG